MSDAVYFCISLSLIVCLSAASDYNVWKSCDPNTPAKLEWTPVVLRTGTTYRINFFYYGITQMLDKINVCVTVRQKDIDDPLYEDCEHHVCDDYLKYVQIVVPEATCPIKLSKVAASRDQFLDYTVPVLEGDFEIKLEVKDENDKYILCLEGDASMVE